MLNPNIARLKRLPLRANEVWQGDVVRMPSWVTGDCDEPYRPWGAIWVAVHARKIGPARMWAPEDNGSGQALQALAEFAADSEVGGYRPGRIEVRDEALARELSVALANVGVEVVCTSDLAAVDDALAALTDAIIAPLPPGALAGEGVTVERMRRFAKAARAFYEAAPWEHLSDEDLLEIRSPEPPRGLRWCTVLGGAGCTFGLGFFDNPQRLWEFRASDDIDDWLDRGKEGLWSLTFGPITELPLMDSDLWLEHDLPVAAAEAYPCAARFDPGGVIERPDATALSHLEGLLAALARSTGKDIDSGRWSVAVETSESKVTFKLALPDLLNPPDRQEMMRRGFQPEPRVMERSQAQMHRLLADRQPETVEAMNEILQKEFIGKEPVPGRFPPRDSFELAQDLCYQAFDAFGRRRIQLARQALEACPDCADAHVLMAEAASDPEEALDSYAKGVAAGERTLGEECFEQDAGRFWGMLNTRPYMRARLGLAECLAALGRVEDAVDHHRELLRLNPDDNQGVRYLYLPRLLELGLDDEAARFMKSSDDEPTAIWMYARALLAFRRGGRSPGARRELRKAINANPLVVDLLIAEEDPGFSPESYSLGSPEEAVICAGALQSAFHATPGMMAWLESASRSGPEGPDSGTRPRPRKRKRKRR